MGPRSRNAAALVVFLIICFAISGLGSFVTAQNIATWYSGLAKPQFNPPNWIFAPVWTTLFLLIAIAGWRVWRNGVGTARQRGLVIYGFQLLLNLLWSFIFFGAHRIDLALIEIVVLLAMIVINALSFWRIDRVAGALLLPYAAWVSFAAVLNFALWRLN